MASAVPALYHKENTMDYKSFDYWKRRMRANTAPLPAGEQKMLFGLFIDKIEELQNELESVRSKGTARSSKKLGTRSDSEGDA